MVFLCVYATFSNYFHLMGKNNSMIRNQFFSPFLAVICLSFLAFQCDDDMTQEDDNARLEVLRLEIENLAKTSICNEATECKYIGFGSKPCGGPLGYLTYSTSIDTEKLEGLVSNYNKINAEYNSKWGIISDCSIVNPPTSIICENNICVAVY